MRTVLGLAARNVRQARHRWPGEVDNRSIRALRQLSEQLEVSIEAGDLLLIDGFWYVSHAGLLRVANRQKCFGIHVRPAAEFCDPASSRWAFKATVYKSRTCRGFVGYGDADPTNVSARVRGAEMRVAETRAIDRALRAAYGIGLCSVEELGSFSRPLETAPALKKPVRSERTNISGNGSGNGNGNGHRLRDRLCLLIRHHQLDPTLVKLYAADFCETKELRDASREQVAEFIRHLEQFAANDRDGLLCQLNSYGPNPETAVQDGAA